MSDLIKDILKAYPDALSSKSDKDDQTSNLILRIILSEIEKLNDSVETIKDNVGTIKSEQEIMKGDIRDMKQKMGDLAILEVKVQTHQQTLFGAEGNNGLNGDMKDVKKDLKNLDGFKTKVVAIASVLSFCASFILGVLKDYFMSGGHK